METKEEISRLIDRIKKYNLYKDHGFDLDKILYLDDGQNEVIMEIYIRRRIRHGN